jgi:hypothetical protein
MHPPRRAPLPRCHAPPQVPYRNNRQLRAFAADLAAEACARGELAGYTAVPIELPADAVPGNAVAHAGVMYMLDGAAEVQRILNLPSLRGKLVFEAAPVEVEDDQGVKQRVYGEPHTGDAWIQQQARLRAQLDPTGVVIAIQVRRRRRARVTGPGQGAGRRGGAAAGPLPARGAPAAAGSGVTSTPFSQPHRPAACPPPPQLSSDKARLTRRNNRDVYPLYMTLYNLPGRSTREAHIVVLAYLPTAPKNLPREARLFFTHAALDVAFAPLKRAGVDGIPITLPDGRTILGYPRLLCYAADDPEAKDLTCAHKGLYQ